MAIDTKSRLWLRWVGANSLAELLGLGAVIAWFLGSLPSTLIDMGGQEAGTATQEPPFVVVMLLAAGMGLVLGAVLGYPQYRVLRKYVQGCLLYTSPSPRD